MPISLAEFLQSLAGAAGGSRVAVAPLCASSAYPDNN